MRIRGPVVLYQPRDQGHVMPLGLLQLGSALRGQPVEIVDGRLDLAPEARVAGLAREALLLGVTVRTGRPIADALRISRAVRTANPDLPIVWGGPHPTLFPGPCLSSEAVDACVVGAGEETLAEAVGALRAGGRGFSGVAGLAWREGDHVVTEPPRGPFDPTRWARADYGLLELDPYFRARGARRLDYCSSRWPWPALPGPTGEVAPLEWSALSPDRVVEDIRELGSRLRPDEVAFQDDDLFARPGRSPKIEVHDAPPLRQLDLLDLFERFHAALHLRGLGRMGGKPIDEPLFLGEHGLLSSIGRLAVRLAQSALAFVEIVVAGVDRHLTAVDLRDLRDDAVQELAIVRGHQQGTREFFQKRFEPDDRLDVEVIGRFIHQQHGGPAEQYAGHRHAHLPAA